MPIGSGRAVGCARDLMDDTSAEHLREQRFRALLEGVPVAAYRWEAGSAGRCLYVSPQIEAMLGFPPGAVDGGSRVVAAAHPPGRPRAGDERRGRRQEDGPARQRVSLPARRRPHRVGSRSGPLGRRRQRRGLLRGRLRRRHRAQAGRAGAHVHGPARSAHRARQPAQFTRQLEYELRRGARPARAVRRHRVLFVDIDRFKLVNDGHGHEAGDALLREAGRRLQAALREGDVLSRFGGDEFTAYLPVCDAGCAEVVARRVLATLAEPFPVARGEVYVGGSVGIALTGGDSDTATDLIRDADVAMYVAKQGGTRAPRALRHEPARGLGQPHRDGQRAPPGARARTRSRWSCSRSSTSATGGSRASRRCCAGGAAARSCRRSISCRWPRRPG